MKRNEIEAIIEQNKRKRTDTLKEYIHDMYGIMEDREKSKNMWFWTDNGNANDRSRKEKWYARDTEINMNGLTVNYDRRISMSRKNVYVHESLSGIKDGEEIKITATDLKKLIAGYKEIVERRTA